MRIHRINARIDDTELAAFEKRRHKAGLSRSEYFRRVLMSRPIPTRQNLTDIQELLRLKADLGRLGNLQKLCIDQIAEVSGSEQKALIAELHDLTGDIRTAQAQIAHIISKIRP